jgi:hypothetical protein
MEKTCLRPFLWRYKIMLFNHSEMTAVAINPHSQVLLDEKSAFYGCVGRGHIHNGKNRSFGAQIEPKRAILFSSYVGTDKPPGHYLRSLTPIAPHSALCQPAAAPVASPAMPLLPTPTTAANDRCNNGGNGHHAAMTASPYHRVSSQWRSRQHGAGTSAPTGNGRINRQPHHNCSSRLRRLL